MVVRKAESLEVVWALGLRAEYPRKGADESQSDADKAKVAVQRSEGTRSFVRQVRAATRRKYTSEEKIRMVLEGFRREVTVNDLCRRGGIKPHSYYAWTKEFMEAGKERLARDTVRDATRQEIQELRRENGELKQLVGELSLQVSRLKKMAIPTLVDVAGTEDEWFIEDGSPCQGSLVTVPEASGAQGLGRSEEHPLPMATSTRAATQP